MKRSVISSSKTRKKIRTRSSRLSSRSFLRALAGNRTSNARLGIHASLLARSAPHLQNFIRMTTSATRARKNLMTKAPLKNRNSNRRRLTAQVIAKSTQMATRIFKSVFCGNSSKREDKG